MSDTEPSASGESRESSEPREADDLSPSVRRVVRQFDLDISKIRGTGPQGQVRLSDVMALVGDRGQAAEELPPLPAARETPRAEETAPMSCVFECDMTRVLAHRKALESRGQSVSTTSYCALAAARALGRLGVGYGAEPGVLAVVVHDGEGVRQATLAGAARMTLVAIDDAIESRLEPEAAGTATLAIHDHGPIGSIVTLPVPIEHGQAASLGVGRIRRIVGIKNGDDAETPRIVAQCLLSLSFRRRWIDLPKATAFLAECVRILESWPAHVDTGAGSPARS